jgi:hypothetical protein
MINPVDLSIAERIWEQAKQNSDSAITVQMQALDVNLKDLRTACAELEAVPAHYSVERREKLFGVALSVMRFVNSVFAFQIAGQDSRILVG